mmetsp:Transcript_40396/g.46301  ORF Transcript_40396/g.46301 Transcript_40396/m.46301 type:complete len:363 (-) Transcript_40396:257-1345(-)
MNQQQLLHQGAADKLALLNNLALLGSNMDPNLMALMRNANSAGLLSSTVATHENSNEAILAAMLKQRQVSSGAVFCKEEIHNSDAATAPSSSIDETSSGHGSDTESEDGTKDSRLASIKKAINKKKYALTSDEIRINLLDMVFNKKITIKKAAEKLGINYSTAKTILQIYKKEGRILKKSWSAKPFIPEMYGLAGSPVNRPEPTTSIAANGVANSLSQQSTSSVQSAAAVAAMAAQNPRVQLSNLLASSAMMKNSLMASSPSSQERIERQPYLDALKEELKALQEKFDEGKEAYLRHIYAKHPPKGSKRLEPEDFKGDKKSLMKVIRYYHPDKNNEKGQAKKWSVLCDEITKYLNIFYEEFK